MLRQRPSSQLALPARSAPDTDCKTFVSRSFADKGLFIASNKSLDRRRSQ